MLSTKKLIIWDFDGVIADTEIIWTGIRIKKLKEHFGISWSLQEANQLIGGMSDRTKNTVLKNMGYNVSPEFWEEIHQSDEIALNKGFERSPYIDDIFNNKQIKQCIATGATMEHTLRKCDITGVSKWFCQKQIFTIEMVKHGKPEPDLFLYAAERMGYTPQECVVIEDSAAGLTAAQKAGMMPIAYVGSLMNNNPKYVKKIKNMGIEYIFNDMRDINILLKGMI